MTLEPLLKTSLIDASGIDATLRAYVSLLTLYLPFGCHAKWYSMASKQLKIMQAANAT
jgi:hypothetical protein